MNFTAKDSLLLSDSILSLGFKFIGISYKDEQLVVTGKLVFLDSDNKIIFETELLEAALGNILNFQITANLN